MTLAIKILVPDGVLYEGSCMKVVGDSEVGAFCLLPNHVDFVTALKPGILSIVDRDEDEVFFAVDQAILVKKSSKVTVSSMHAVRGALGELKGALLKQKESRVTLEHSSRSALDRLEASLVRQILEWEGPSRA